MKIKEILLSILFFILLSGIFIYILFNGYPEPLGLYVGLLSLPLGALLTWKGVMNEYNK